MTKKDELINKLLESKSDQVVVAIKCGGFKLHKFEIVLNEDFKAYSKVINRTFNDDLFSKKIGLIEWYKFGNGESSQ